MVGAGRLIAGGKAPLLGLEIISSAGATLTLAYNAANGVARATFSLGATQGAPTGSGTWSLTGALATADKANLSASTGASVTLDLTDIVIGDVGPQDLLVGYSGEQGAGAVVYPLSLTLDDPAVTPATLRSFSLTDTSEAGSTVLHRMGLSFEQGEVTSGQRLRTRVVGGADTAYAECERVTYSDGSLKKITLLMLGTALGASASQSYEVYKVNGTQAASGFNPWTWLAANAGAAVDSAGSLTVQIASRTGSLSGALGDLTYSLRTAIDTTARREILADTTRFVRCRAWQKVAGEEHLIADWHLDFWLNPAGTAPIALEWTVVMRLPFGINAPFGTTQSRQRQTYTATIKHGSTTVDTRAALAHVQHCSWASLRSANDAQHARKHWIDLSGDGSGAMPTLRLGLPAATLRKGMLTGHLPPVKLGVPTTVMPSGVVDRTTYTPLSANGHRTGGLAAGGDYTARGLITTYDTLALHRQTDAAWRSARIAAQAGLAYYFDVCDHRVNASVGDVALRRIPTPVKAVGAGRSYTGLGTPISVVIDDRGTADLEIAAAHSQHGAATWLSADGAHWPDPAYFMAFIEGERYLTEAVLASAELSRMWAPYSTSGHDKRATLCTGPPVGTVWTTRGIPATVYGQSLSFSQERDWCATAISHALALLPDNDPHRVYMEEVVQNFAAHLTASLSYAPQAQKDKGVVYTALSNWGSLWMTTFTALSLYSLWRQAERVSNRASIKAVAEVAAKRVTDTFDLAATQANHYRDLPCTSNNFSSYLPVGEVLALYDAKIENSVVIPTGSPLFVRGGALPTNGDIVYLNRVDTSGTDRGAAAVPEGEGIKRYVVEASGNTFRLAASQGGAPITYANVALTGVGIMMQQATAATERGLNGFTSGGYDYDNIARAGFEMAALNEHPSIDGTLKAKVRTYFAAQTYGDDWMWWYDADEPGA